jgi:hypothetical protein
MGVAKSKFVSPRDYDDDDNNNEGGVAPVPLVRTATKHDIGYDLSQAAIGTADNALHRLRNNVLATRKRNMGVVLMCSAPGDPANVARLMIMLGKNAYTKSCGYDARSSVNVMAVFQDAMQRTVAGLLNRSQVSDALLGRTQNDALNLAITSALVQHCEQLEASRRVQKLRESNICVDSFNAYLTLFTSSQDDLVAWATDELTAQVDAIHEREHHADNEHRLHHHEQLAASPREVNGHSTAADPLSYISALDAVSGTRDALAERAVLALNEHHCHFNSNKNVGEAQVELFDRSAMLIGMYMRAYNMASNINYNMASALGSLSRVISSHCDDATPSHDTLPVVVCYGEAYQQLLIDVWVRELFHMHSPSSLHHNNNDGDAAKAGLRAYISTIVKSLDFQMRDYCSRVDLNALLMLDWQVDMSQRAIDACAAYARNESVYGFNSTLLRAHDSCIVDVLLCIVSDFLVRIHETTPREELRRRPLNHTERTHRLLTADGIELTFEFRSPRHVFVMARSITTVERLRAEHKQQQQQQQAQNPASAASNPAAAATHYGATPVLDQRPILFETAHPRQRRTRQDDYLQEGYTSDTDSSVSSLVERPRVGSFDEADYDGDNDDDFTNSRATYQSLDINNTEEAEPPPPSRLRTQAEVDLLRALVQQTPLQETSPRALFAEPPTAPPPSPPPLGRSAADAAAVPMCVVTQ